MFESKAGALQCLFLASFQKKKSLSLHSSQLVLKTDLEEEGVREEKIREARGAESTAVGRRVWEGLVRGWSGDGWKTEGEGLGRVVSLTSRGSSRVGGGVSGQDSCLQLYLSRRHLENKHGPSRCKVHVELNRK